MTPIIIVIVFLLTLLIWWLGALYLRGPSLLAWDDPATGPKPEHRQQFGHNSSRNTEHQAVVASLGGMSHTLKGTPRSQHLPLLRNYMDNFSAGRSFTAQFIAVDVKGIAAEWVMAPGADPNRRTLYIHGGAWIMGSPRSHRVITTRFSEISGGAVLAIDYRLMPEHPRQAGIEDCRTAYRWLLENGPQGAAPAETVFIAGDSAGGNLTLSLSAWVRDQRLRAPDAVVALSPATDATLRSTSLKTNLATDDMLAPLFGHLARVPHSALMWFAALQNRMRPCNPVLSPAYGDLSRLPPTLIQASDVEMLRDDSVRYANKAVAAGSPVQLQTWNHVVHVWHIFDPELTEARQAFEEIGRFLAQSTAATTAATTSGNPG